MNGGGGVRCDLALKISTKNNVALALSASTKHAGQEDDILCCRQKCCEPALVTAFVNLVVPLWREVYHSAHATESPLRPRVRFLV